MKKKNSNIILVGAGDYYGKIAAPCFSYLQKIDMLGNVTTIDTDANTHANYLRKKNQKLSEIIHQIESKTNTQNNSVIVLAHPNHLHTPDAIDTLQNTDASVLIEKPYSIDSEQINILTSMLDTHQKRIGLLEYYLTMKAAPLELFAGLIKEDSFFFTHNGILKQLSNQTISTLSGKIKEFIGKPLHVITDCLEGEGSFGTVAHRNLSLIDKRQGGGMLQDLGLHALSPLFALSSYLGDINIANLIELKCAICNEYEISALEKGIQKEHIGESYAQATFVTSTNVPVQMSVGKYIQNGQNQRRIIITGTRGIVIYDMTQNILALQKGDSIDGIIPLIEADKSGKVVPKYLAVIQSALQSIKGENPFKFDPNYVALKAQELIINLTNKTPDQVATYAQGTMHDRIF